jgi:Glu-tRNA(Gln) amidotransferase subunit E-like FAD-binding protein
MKFTEIFTFLRENKVFAELRARAVDLLLAKKDDFKAIIEEYVKEKSPAIKEKAVAFIMNHIELKFPYKLFKGTIKKNLNKNFDKLVEFLLAKLQEI